MSQLQVREQHTCLSPLSMQTEPDAVTAADCRGRASDGQNKYKDRSHGRPVPPDAELQMDYISYVTAAAAKVQDVVWYKT